MDENAVKELQLTEKDLQDMVEALGKAVKPRVLYRPDHHQMTEEALDICQQDGRRGKTSCDAPAVLMARG